MNYEAINLSILSRIPKNIKRVLDLGCGTGALGRKIQQDISCEVIGVTYSELEADIASKVLDKVLVCDLNSFDPQDLGQFDCIVCSHSLDHLYQPQDLLNRLHSSLTSQSLLIVALPNILHWKQRLEFLKGHFKYTDGGLMDRTHFRFFDWETARELLECSNYQVIESEADGAFPLPVVRKLLPNSVSSWIDKKALKRYPGLFGFQFVFSCRSHLTEI